MLVESVDIIFPPTRGSGFFTCTANAILIRLIAVGEGESPRSAPCDVEIGKEFTGYCGLDVGYQTIAVAPDNGRAGAGRGRTREFVAYVFAGFVSAQLPLPLRSIWT